MPRFRVGTVPLPSESLLSIMSGSGAAGARSRPGSGWTTEAVGRSSGCGDSAQFGASAVPLAGTACRQGSGRGELAAMQGWLPHRAAPLWLFLF